MSLAILDRRLRPTGTIELVASVGLVIVLIGLHTGVSVAEGQTVLVPYALALLGSIIIYAAAWRNLNGSVVTSLALVGFLIVAHLAITLITNPSDILDRVRSTGIFVASILIGGAAFLSVRSISTAVFERIFLIFAIICITGAMLDLYTFVGSISDEFRQSVNSWRSVYENDTRDILNYGGRRPKFFASEPSALGFSIYISLLAWYCSRSATTARFFQYFVLTAVAAVFVRSPTVIIGFCIGSALGYIVRPNLGYMRVAVIVAIALLFSLLPVFWSHFYTSNSLSGYLSTGSMFMRGAAPALMAVETFSERPLFGFGVGDSASLDLAVRQVFFDSGAAIRYRYLSDFSGRSLLTNAAWEFWIYFGIFGGLAIGAAIWKMLKSMRSQYPILLLAFGSLIWNTFGGINTPIPWVALLILPALFYRQTGIVNQGKGRAPRPLDGRHQRFEKKGDAKRSSAAVWR